MYLAPDYYRNVYQILQEDSAMDEDIGAVASPIFDFSFILHVLLILTSAVLGNKISHF